MASIHSSNGTGRADKFMGLEWGDEGKGRFVDLVADRYDIVARHNGGPNAGHSIQANGHEIGLHQVPSGVCYPGKKLYIASGCVVDMPLLLQEIREIEDRAHMEVRSRLRISAQASIIQPHHILMDKAMMGSVGTTGKGIGPAYGSQGLRVDGDRRVDIRIGELLDDEEESFSIIERNLRAEIERLRSQCLTDDKERIAQLTNAFDVETKMNELRLAFSHLRPLIDQDARYLLKQMRKGMMVLLEGAQAFGLDKTYGAPPYVTSSNVGVGAALNSTGIPPEYMRHTYGVAKLTPSRVGYGPFVGELGGKQSEDHCMADEGKKHTREVERVLYGNHLDDMLASGDPLQTGIAIRIKTGEYGVTSGRARRLGVSDFRHLEAAADINGIRGLFLSKLDVLQLYSQTKDKSVPFVSGYELDGHEIDYVPTSANALGKVTPVYTHMQAFGDDLSNIRDRSQLPTEALAMIEKIEEQTGVPVLGVGVGPKREQYVPLRKL